MIRLVDKSFKYHLDYNYDTKYNCEEVGCDDICRCATIHNAKVIFVNMIGIINDIYNIYFDDSITTKRDSYINYILFGINKEIDLYTIDRILRINKVYNYDNWHINICNGYYGEEIDSIFLNNANKIESEITNAFMISDLNLRIEYLLKLEYGYILPELEGCSYELCDVLLCDINFGSISNYTKSRKQDLSHYLDINYNGIRAIVIETINGKYRLIDGYHRCSASTKNIVRILKAVKK